MNIFFLWWPTEKLAYRLRFSCFSQLLSVLLFRNRWFLSLDRYLSLRKVGTLFFRDIWASNKPLIQERRSLSTLTNSTEYSLKIPTFLSTWYFSFQALHAIWPNCSQTEGLFWPLFDTRILDRTLEFIFLQLVSCLCYLSAPSGLFSAVNSHKNTGFCWFFSQQFCMQSKLSGGGLPNIFSKILRLHPFRMGRPNHNTL